ncbi:MAG: class B sortase, partial [Clostridiales bacterium]|nr:class B sortase [Clostridiales bacterium]
DINCSQDFSDFSSIVYGHHMEKQAMFGEIGSFADKAFFEARRYGMLFYQGQEHGLEFFAFIHTDAYNDEVYRTKIAGPEIRQAYVDMLFAIATYMRDIAIGPDDHIVLFSTCSESTTNGRDILLGKISDELYEDTFINEGNITVFNNLAAVDAISGLWASAPLWIKIIVVALPLLLLSGAGFMIIRKRRKINGL